MNNQSLDINAFVILPACISNCALIGFFEIHEPQNPTKQQHEKEGRQEMSGKRLAIFSSTSVHDQYLPERT